MGTAGLFNEYEYRYLVSLSWYLCSLVSHSNTFSISSLLLHRIVRWGNIIGKTKEYDINKNLADFGVPLSRSTYWRAMTNIRKTGLFIFLNNDYYSINFPGILKYYLANASLSNDALEFNTKLLVKTEMIYRKESLPTDMKLEAIVKKSVKKNLEEKSEYAKGTPAFNSLVLLIKETSSDYGIPFTIITSAREKKKINYFMKECSVENKDAHQIIINVIKNWRNIQLYLVEITGYKSIDADTFSFETFFNFRGYIYDYLSVCEVAGNNSNPMEIVRSLLSSGMTPDEIMRHKTKANKLQGMLDFVQNYDYGPFIKEAKPDAVSLPGAWEKIEEEVPIEEVR